MLKKSLWLELDVAGRNLVNLCLHLLTPKVFSLCTKGSVVLYSSEIWAEKEEDGKLSGAVDVQGSYCLQSQEKRYPFQGGHEKS